MWRKAHHHEAESFGEPLLEANWSSLQTWVVPSSSGVCCQAIWPPWEEHQVSLPPAGPLFFALYITKSPIISFLRTLLVVLTHSWNIKNCISGHSNTFNSLYYVYRKTKALSRQAKLRMWARSGPSVGLCVAASVAANTQFQLDLSAPFL